MGYDLSSFFRLRLGFAEMRRPSHEIFKERRRTVAQFSTLLSARNAPRNQYFPLKRRLLDL